MRFSFATLDLVVLLSTWLPLSSALPTLPPLADYQIRNFHTINKIYQFTVYPRQEAIIAQVTSDSIPELEPLFSPTVSGRIQEIGNFTNFRHSIEYFFGLAPRPQGSMYSAIVEAELTQFSSDHPSIAASTVNFKVALDNPSKPGFGAPGTRTYTYLKQTGFWHFDEEGRVDYYDLYIPALNEFATILNGADFNSKLVQLLATKQICQGAQKLCKGKNTQYHPQIGLNIGAVLNALGLSPLLDLPLINQLGLGSLNLGELTCFAKLSAKNFGTFDKLWADTVTCRIVHLMLAEVDPDDHCEHVGPTGGGKCVEYPYYDRQFKDNTLFGDTRRFRSASYSSLTPVPPAPPKIFVPSAHQPTPPTTSYISPSEKSSTKSYQPRRLLLPKVLSYINYVLSL
ncbi:hypothetical protein TWF106_005856 [Orbilia oligospora]|uniref:Uncharacterized protein n=1 Tax=Orbilia oligospora TaxID=2813651 RepID=A0A7C8UUU6_ORBOL|nr:hypothetical protein TWF106_005856 [Orbilia oligospora]